MRVRPNTKTYFPRPVAGELIQGNQEPDDLTRSLMFAEHLLQSGEGWLCRCRGSCAGRNVARVYGGRSTTSSERCNGSRKPIRNTTRILSSSFASLPSRACGPTRNFASSSRESVGTTLPLTDSPFVRPSEKGAWLAGAALVGESCELISVSF